MTFVGVRGRPLTEDDKTVVDLTLLAGVTEFGSGATLASGSLGIEISSGVRFLYTCRMVEEESDPAIRGEDPVGLPDCLRGHRLVQARLGDLVSA